MTETTGKTALILGATGGAGYETAKALAARGWRIRAMHRDPQKVSALLPDAAWVPGDAMRQDDVVAAAVGCDVIFHGVNPPGYRDWAGRVLPMAEATIAAARRTGARIVLPGTVYNFGPDAFPLLREDDAQAPATRKGRIRVALEQRLHRAAKAEGVPVLILRAGDFFGPHVSGNSWFTSALVKAGRPVRSVLYPGRPDIGHAWAYLPDFAETVAQLVARDDLPRFARFHLGGHWFDRGVEIAERLRVVAGVPDAPIRRMPWALLPLLAPFSVTLRELREMRYLWQVPVRLDNAALVDLLGSEPHTPIDTALRHALQGMGCLPPAVTSDFAAA
ncbi:NAD(P)H-binding protein [Psychromarinibacter halotolerans]|uniref:NAD(P)H-binding protein n=1 Tax=Psychromarinibacter halotolerans TaxID=1775175 RepID=A0ABV7GTQ3_9RHOB|nr:NAD(P)H-binding protein [Psychromarinibacter halotolerans]MDF0594629.1 NAD(P)H-binding protein [Psychromarinibacter halotolerans]